MKQLNYLDYREALGIGFDDEVKMDHFQTQCLNLLKSRENFEYSVDDYVDFCNAVSATYNYEFGSLYDAICILEGFEGKYFLFAMIAFANTFNHYEDMQEFFKEEIIKYLNNSKLFHRIITDEDGIFVLPEGAKELDDNNPNKNDRKDPKTIAALVNEGRFSFLAVKASSIKIFSSER